MIQVRWLLQQFSRFCCNNVKVVWGDAIMVLQQFCDFCSKGYKLCSDAGV